MGHVTAPFQRANPRGFLHRSCGRKVVHPTEEVAESARRLTEAATGDGPLHSYRCDFCAGWHVGHVVRFVTARPVVVGHSEMPERRAPDRDRRRKQRRRWAVE